MLTPELQSLNPPIDLVRVISAGCMFVAILQVLNGTGETMPVHIYCQCSRSPFYVLMTFKIVAEIYYFLFVRLTTHHKRDALL